MYEQQPDDVLVLVAWEVTRVFERRMGALGADAVEAVFQKARREATWKDGHCRE